MIIKDKKQLIHFYSFSIIVTKKNILIFQNEKNIFQLKLNRVKIIYNLISFKYKYNLNIKFFSIILQSH